LNGNVIFDSAVSISNASNVTFGAGTYWFKGGLTVSGASVTFGAGTSIFGVPSMVNPTTGLSITNGATATFASAAAGGNLLYIAGGSLTFAGGVQDALVASQGYSGITIWDAGASGTTNPISLSNGSSVAVSYGGIYAPSGAVSFSGAAAISAAFLIANTANLSNGTTLALG
jgi:hypothetical protein